MVHSAEGTCNKINYCSVLFNMETIGEKVSQKVAFGLELLKVLCKYEDLAGVQKLRKKITQELNFLERVIAFILL